MDNPFFSIIIPTYNRCTLLKTAIDSVLKQTYSNWELIIINDASSDSTEQYLNAIEKDNIIVLHNKKNLHKGGTRNEGIKIAKGKYICFLDDDDYYFENHLDVFYNNIINKNYPVAVFYTMPITQDIKTKEYVRKILEPFGEKNQVEYLFHHKNGVPTPRMCINKMILKQELFNPNIRIGQDTELLLRIAAKYPVFPINEHTSVMVKHESNSGALINNTGKDRLNGYKYIFSNKDVNKYIPRKLRRYMISYCHLRSADHFDFMNNRKYTLIFAFKSLWYSPIDKNFKIKIVYILYNLPFIGTFIKKIIRKIKK